MLRPDVSMTSATCTGANAAREGSCEVYKRGLHQADETGPVACTLHINAQCFAKNAYLAGFGAFAGAGAA